MILSLEEVVEANDASMILLKQGWKRSEDFYREVSERKRRRLCSQEKNLLKSTLLMQIRSRMKIGGAILSD